MKNKYVEFVSDDHLLMCIGNLHEAYLKAKNNINKKQFYKNKIDTVKLMFDAKFNGVGEESLIEAEIARQIDKSVNNSIGTFHEEVLGGIKGFERKNSSGFDIKANDNSIFAIYQFVEIDRKFEKGLFEQITSQAVFYKGSTWYLVDFFSNRTYCEPWILATEESTIKHKRVFKISVDKLYAVLTRNEDAIFQLNKVLPNAIEDFKKMIL